MIPYEELVSALSQWRARNGLATEAETFLSGPTPSVAGAVHDAALPLTGGEIVDLEEEGAFEEIEAYDEEVESAVAGIGDDADYAAEGEPAGEAAYADAANYDESDYVGEVHEAEAQGAEVVEVDDGFEVESVVADEAGDFEPFEGEATAFSQAPEAPEAESTRVGAAPDFVDPDDPANRSE